MAKKTGSHKTGEIQGPSSMRDWSLPFGATQKSCDANKVNVDTATSRNDTR